MPTKSAREPGPKPDYAVVENHLKCQTDEGEISIDLRIPIDRLELFMDMQDVEATKMPRHILDHILHPEDKAKIEGMRDGVKGYAILMKFAEKIGERMGAGLGESKGSTASSESTEEPSATTSDATTD